MGVTGEAFYYYVYEDSNTSLSCFNAFSRVDIRVDVKIPGGVSAYVVDLRGERYVDKVLFHVNID
jgi:ChAPs (Chs5p-Arf1p-binding proteins)